MSISAQTRRVRSWTLLFVGLWLLFGFHDSRAQQPTTSDTDRTVQRFINELQSSDRSLRRRATDTLRKIGPDDKESVPLILDALQTNDSRVSSQLSAALGRIGSAAVPHLVKAVDHNDLLKVRLGAIGALGIIHSTPESSVPCLVRALSDDSDVVRRAAVVALREFGTEAKPAVEAIAFAVNDVNKNVQLAALKTIAAIGPTAGEAIPTLLNKMLDEDPLKSHQASVALRQVGPTSDISFESLLAATKDAASHVRRNAVWVLGCSRDLSQRAMPRLLELLADEDEAVVRTTLLALGDFGPDATEAVAPLIKATRSKNRLVKALAEQALRQIAPDRALELFGERFDAVQARLEDIKEFRVREHDSPQLGGSRFRNNTPAGTNIPATWNVGNFDRRTGEWISDEAINIKWVARLGSQSYGNPVVANGKIYVGTNNAAGYLKRYPSRIDVSCLLCFRESDGKFLWQHSSEKLPTGRVHDWPLQGICSSPVIEGNRLWFVTSRGEVRCLDTNGFHDEEDDGPVRNEEGTLFDVRRRDSTDEFDKAVAALRAGRLTPFVRGEFKRVGMELPDVMSITAIEPDRRWRLVAEVGSSNRQFNCVVRGPRLHVSKLITADDQHEADVVWKFNMMEELGVFQHNMATCSPTIWGDTLFICTSNGLDESHVNLPAPEAPSFMAMNKNTGEVIWTDNSPGANILHGQWSCPVIGVFDGVPQVIFPGGDGWLYSFRADRWKDGKPELLWKFDANPKDSEWVLGGRGTRNNLIAVPVIYDGFVYVAVGQDPEHGEGDGHLWCIDPTKRGDVSKELVVDADGNVMPHRRIKAVVYEPTEVIFRLYSQDAEGLTDRFGEGVIPEPVKNAFARSGYRLPESRTLQSAEKNGKWLVNAHIDGRNQQFRISIGKTVTAERDTNDERVIANPNSAVVWHYDKFDCDGDGEIGFEEEFHRTISSPVIKNNLLVITDFSGLVHCLNAKTGIPYWTCDLLSQCWSTPLIVENKVYVSDEDGDVALFDLSADPGRSTEANTDPDWGGLLPLHENPMGSSVYSTPIVANNVLYIANKTHLFAIEAQDE